MPMNINDFVFGPLKSYCKDCGEEEVLIEGSICGLCFLEAYRSVFILPAKPPEPYQLDEDSTGSHYGQDAL